MALTCGSPKTSLTSWANIPTATSWSADSERRWPFTRLASLIFLSTVFLQNAKLFFTNMHCTSEDAIWDFHITEHMSYFPFSPCTCTVCTCFQLVCNCCSRYLRTLNSVHEGWRVSRILSSRLASVSSFWPHHSLWFCLTFRPSNQTVSMYTVHMESAVFFK